MTKVREPTSIIEMAERVRHAQEQLLTRKELSDDNRAIAEGILASLRECDFYEIDQGVAKAADGMFETLFAGKDTQTITLDKDCRLPSPTCAFWSPGTNVQFAEREEEFPMMYLAQEDAEETFVILVSPYFGGLMQGGYQLEVEGGLVGPPEGSEEDKTIRATHVLSVAAMCSLLNQPGFTKREAVGSRQERRAATRSGGYATDAWHKVTWNIGEAVKAKLQSDDPVRCMPLHYTRGHWRKAQEGWINTSQRKDGHWYQWIEGFWSGHPAFGVKKSYHAPKMGKSS
jgi:hypothetical protein